MIGAQCPEQKWREKLGEKIKKREKPNTPARVTAAKKPSFFDPDHCPIQIEPFAFPAIDPEIAQENVARIERNFRASVQREARRQSGEDNSLVNIRKSPTGHFDPSMNNRKPVFRVYERAWAGQVRVGVESFTRSLKAPDAPQGDRYTTKLSNRAVRAITDAGAYVATCKSGFTTFLTLTFDADARARIESEQTTIGAEVARFVDGLQKKRKRGWNWEPTPREVEEMPILQGLSRRFDGETQLINYIWVAEAPPKKEKITNIAGETIETLGAPNPHVHMLLDWSVEKEHFQGWAAQIESLWGNGFAKLEKIRDAEAATGYLLKALGYLTKASQETHHINAETGELHFSQGRIRGNRYGISKGARAPDWECVAEFEAQQIGRYLFDFGKSLEAQAARIKSELEESAQAIKHDKAQLAKAQRMKKAPRAVIQEKITRITKRLHHEQQRRAALKALRRQSAHGGRYRVTFKSQSQFKAFIAEAVERVGWQANEYKTRFCEFAKGRQLDSWVKETGQWFKANYERYWANIIASREPVPRGQLEGVFIDKELYGFNY